MHCLVGFLGGLPPAISHAPSHSWHFWLTLNKQECFLFSPKQFTLAGRFNVAPTSVSVEWQLITTISTLPMFCSLLPTLGDMWSSHSTVQCTSRPWAESQELGAFECNRATPSTVPTHEYTGQPDYNQKNKTTRVRTLRTLQMETNSDISRLANSGEG